MTLKTKLRIVTAGSAVGLLAVAFFWIRDQRSSLFEERRQKTRNLVEVPYSLLESMYLLESQGKISRAEAQRQAGEAIRAMRYEGGNYFWINDDHPTMIMHPTKPELNGHDLTSVKDPAGKALFVECVQAAQNPAGGYVYYLWPKPGSERPQPKLSFVRRFAPWGWIIGTGIYIDDVDAALRKSAITAVGLTLACLIPLTLMSIATSRSTMRRLHDIIAHLKKVAAGDLTQRVTTGSNDELDQMAAALNATMQTMSEVLGEIKQQSFNVANASEEFSAVSQQISANSEETSAQANAVTAATEQVNRGLQTVAGATEQMSASIREIAKNATEAAKVADNAMKTATETNTIVAKLGDSSAQIGQVIKVITSIAQKTDLLALNATVEAARAGEVGAGFAVVANEVKELAKQTTSATEDIGHKIAAIQSDAKNAVRAIASITGVIGMVNDISSTIATAVEQQSATTAGMSRNISEAARGSSEVAQNIQGVAQAAHSTSHGATDSHKAAQSLAKMSTQLRELVDRFKLDDRDGAAIRPGSGSATETTRPRMQRVESRREKQLV